MKLRRAVKPRSAATCDFVAIGENSIDTIAAGPAMRGLHGKHALHTLVELPGGQAATAAVACARLGWRVRYAGVVGEDAAGIVVRQTLRDEGVDAHLVIRAGRATRRAIVLVDSETGERTILEHRDQALAFMLGELPVEVYLDSRVALVDGTDPVTARLALDTAHTADVRTLIDIDRLGPGIAELISAVDVVIVPRETAVELTGVGDVGRALRTIGEGSDALAVVGTLGAEGVLAWADGREFRLSAHQVHVVDTTGAGDAFRAGFAAAWLGAPGGDPDFEDLLAGGTLLAGLACRGLGAQTSLPQRLEVPEHLWGSL